ncbi:membrane dipeptidase [Eudoraea chungangensis]|uniref:membrane dipeptidase n=1 Tax=Eudoraea chungangensis TaxID=1481905 RepID=UPI0023EAD83F
MPTYNQYIDLHCHPSLKPYGKSFNHSPLGKQAIRRNNNKSLWYYNPPSNFDKLLNMSTGLTKFSQANFTSLANGKIGIVCISLYPLEKWFVRNKIKGEVLLDIAANFALGIGKKRIDYLQSITDYYEDVKRQYNFYLQLDGKIVKLARGRYRYKLVKNFQEIENFEINNSTPDVQTIFVILSIEGLHVLNTGLGKTPDEEEVLRNLDKIKNWKHRPFFITLAHHFWNHICGHAPSLSGIILKFAEQTEGMGVGFTPLGKKVLDKLLDSKGPGRIFPDIKHMSVKARKEYYGMLSSGKEKFRGIPIIASHAACNGLISFDKPVPGNTQTTSKLNPVPINLYNHEVVLIAKSQGIIGLQLDERRIANRNTIRRTKKSVYRNKIMHYRSELLWFQVQHVAELLDKEGLFAWDCLAIGSDFDGIIDSLNGFWTEEEMPFLADFLERHAHNFLSNAPLHQPRNNIAADEVVYRIMGQNAYSFLKTHF